MNHTYPMQPVQSPPEEDPAAARAEAQLHYQTYDTPLATFAADLSEAMAFENLEQLALLLRKSDAGILDELWRMFDSYWSRVIRNRIERGEL